MYPLPLGPPSHPTPHPTHVGSHRAPSWAPCAIQQVPTSYLFYAWQCIYVYPNLPIRPTLPFPPVSTRRFSISTSLFLPWKQVHLLPFFYIPHVCVNIQYLFFSLWLTSLCMTHSRSIHISTNDPISFLFMANIPLHICTTSSLSIHLSLDI